MGKLVEELFDTKDKRKGWPMRYVYTYGATGTLANVKVYDESGGLYETTTRVYESEGREALSLTLLADGSFKAAEFITFDAQHNLLEKLAFTEEPAFKEKITYVYDNKNRLRQEEATGHFINYIYGPDGYLKKKEWLDKVSSHVQQAVEFEDKGIL